ncbi:MAG: penicillin-binding transpeptidase domain-containing protein [Planctomycetota bacterium]
MLGASCVLAIRLFTLTVVQGSAFAQAAEERLDVEKLLPTWRGKLLDRKGRVLSEDVPSYDVAVSYALAKGTWAKERAEAAVRATAGSGWRKLKQPQRDERITESLPQWEQRQALLLKILATRSGLSLGEFEKNLNAIATRIDEQAAAVFRRQIETRRARGQSLDVKPEPIREMHEMHVVFRDVANETVFEMRKLSDAYPGAIELIDAVRRQTPWQSAEVEVPQANLPRKIRQSIPLVLKMNGALDQLVGSVRDEAWKEDLERRPFERTLDDGTTKIDLGGYRASHDTVGSRGMEKKFEDDLRGIRGESVRRLDSSKEDRIEPIPGKDVTLSIDAQLQMRVQAALDPRTGLTSVQPWHTHSDALIIGEALPAAAVIIDVATGEVLAAASTPLPQDQKFGGRTSMASETANINRAIEAAYPPGSLVKPLVYLAAVTEGVLREDEAIECNGHFFKDRTDAARCWTYRERYHFKHEQLPVGPLGVEVALAQSCNIYFYTLANRLGAERLCEWYRRFGLGTLGGTIPSAQAAALVDSRHDQFSAVSLGIGQGPMTVTPLEMANAYAIFARGGSVRSPSFLAGGNKTSAMYTFSPTAVSRTLDGLHRVVSESYGTGNHFDYKDGSPRDPIIDTPGVRVWAKTGTAEAPPLKVDRDQDGVIDRTVTDADHAWCATLVANQGDTTPRYAIAVIVEHGGGGGRTAGPVMGAVIRALVSEGYLIGDGTRNAREQVNAGAVR